MDTAAIANTAAGIAGELLGVFVPLGGLAGMLVATAATTPGVVSAYQQPQSVEQEFQKRRLKEVGLVPGGSTKGSLFFPFTAHPKALKFTYKVGAQDVQHLIDLGPVIQRIYAEVSRLILTTEKGNYTGSEDPASTVKIEGKDIAKLTLEFSRPLSQLEASGISLAFTPADMPCKPQTTKLASENRELTLSGFQSNCLSKQTGPFQVIVTGLNVQSRAFAFNLVR